jgi:N-acetylneuraminate synthase
MSLRDAIAATGSGRSLAGRSGCIVVGEVGQAHDGSLGLAHAFVDAIADAGADAVKFQTHLAAAESTRREPWRVHFSRQDDTRYDYWQRTQFTPDQWAGLKSHAEDRGLVFLSSPFSVEAVRVLADLDIAAWKVASGEISNLPLLEAMAAHPVPMLLSSGMSSIAELDTAVEIVTGANLPFAVMQCTSAYPCPPQRIGLNLLSVFRDRYQCPVGLSDHSGTPYPGLAASVLGADVVEVHVTLSRHMFGPDLPASLTPAELHDLVTGIHCIETMLAHPLDKDAISAELDPLRRLFTKSVVARTDLDAGIVLQPEHLTTKKPGTGIPAARLGQLVGTRLLRDLRADDLVAEADIEEMS